MSEYLPSTLLSVAQNDYKALSSLWVSVYLTDTVALLVLRYSLQSVSVRTYIQLGLVLIWIMIPGGWVVLSSSQVPLEIARYNEFYLGPVVMSSALPAVLLSYILLEWKFR